MSDETYTKDQVLKMIREEVADAVAGEALFTKALADWFVEMFDEPPDLALTCAKRVESFVTDAVHRNKAPQAQREHARRIAIGLKVDVARRLDSPSPP